MTASAEKESKKGINRTGLLIFVPVCLLLVPLVYWLISWQAGFVLLLLLPLIAFWLFMPRKLLRLFLYAYLVYVVAFVCITWLQLQLAGNPRWVSFIEDHAVIRFFLGGDNGFAKQILFSLVVGTLVGFMVVNIPFWAVLYVSSEWVLALRGSTGADRNSALRSLRSLVLGTQYPWLIVDDGRVTESKPKGLLPALGGPGKAVIRPGHAVVFQRLGKITQIQGPGMVNMERYEEIRAVVELKPMWHSKTLENVLTKDRIALRITFGVGFQIEPKSEVDKRPESHQPPDGVALTPLLADDAYPVYEGSIRKAVFKPAGDWQLTAFGLGEGILRDILATYYLDQVFKKVDEPDHDDGPGRFDPDERTISQIEQKILEKHRSIAPNWGIHTTAVDIQIIELPAEAREQMLEWWKAGWRRRMLLAEAEAAKDAAIRHGEGEAGALSAREKVRARAQFDMIRAIFGGLRQMTAQQRNALLGLRFLEALEKIADDPATKILLPGNFDLGDLGQAMLLQEPSDHTAPTPHSGDDDAGPSDASNA